MDGTLAYANRGDIRLARITEHARCRFILRWKRVFAWRSQYGDRLGGVFDPYYLAELSSGDTGRVDAVIGEVFARAAKIPRARYDRRLLKRDRRHGGHARFRVAPFDFIFKNGALVTVEISSDDVRHLNNGGETETPPRAAA